jgi:hypothetical protein
MSRYNFLPNLLARWSIPASFLFLWLPTGFADSPATQPVVEGPKEAFKAFVIDLRKGDAKDLPGGCVATQDDSQALLHEFQSLATAIGDLRDAAAKKFGADAVESLMPDMSSPDDVDDMTETDAADHVELRGEAGNVRLIKSDGRWKLDMDDLRHSPDIPANPHYFSEFAQGIHRTADDIRSGRIDSAASAAEAIRAREQAIDADAPATQPATQP